MTLTKGHGCSSDQQKFACLLDKVRTADLIITKLGSSISLDLFLTWLNFGGILLETFWERFFFFFTNLGYGFFVIKHSISHIFGMVGLIHLKQKGSASIECWADYVILAFDHNPWPWPCILRSNFEITVYQEWEGQLTWNVRDVSRSFIFSCFGHQDIIWTNPRILLIGP